MEVGYNVFNKLKMFQISQDNNFHIGHEKKITVIMTIKVNAISSSTTDVGKEIISQTL